jgi:hypothetical protein
MNVAAKAAFLLTALEAHGLLSTSVQLAQALPAGNSLKPAADRRMATGHWAIAGSVAGTQSSQANSSSAAEPGDEYQHQYLSDTISKLRLQVRDLVLCLRLCSSCAAGFMCGARPSVPMTMLLPCAHACPGRQLRCCLQALAGSLHAALALAERHFSAASSQSYSTPSSSSSSAATQESGGAGNLGDFGSSGLQGHIGSRQGGYPARGDATKGTSMGTLSPPQHLSCWDGIPYARLAAGYLVSGLEKVATLSAPAVTRGNQGFYEPVALMRALPGPAPLASLLQLASTLL